MNDGKSVASIRIDASMMAAQLKADTLEAYRESLRGEMAGVVDTSSTEAMLASIIGDE